MEPVFDATARLVREVLGADALGAYVHGSAVMGGLRATSDADVLAVTAGRTSPSQRRAIAEGLLEFSGRRARRGPDRPVELTVVARSEVRPWRFPPRRELQYGEWLRDDVEAGRIEEPQPDPDLAILLTMAITADHGLFGPPIRELLDPVPRGDVLQAARACVPGLMRDLDGDTRNVVLTLARVWSTLATREIMSKDAAADWALARLPNAHRSVVARARDSYLDPTPGHGMWDDVRPEVRAYAAHVTAALEELAPLSAPARFEAG